MSAAAVHEVLALRAPDQRGLSRMVAWSLTVHATAIALLILAPYLGWIKPRTADKVLVITLGGNAGPKDSVTPNTVGGRPIDQVAPEPKRPEPIKPVVTKPDTMVVPTKTTPPPKAPPKAPPKEQAKAPSPTVQPPTKGPQVTPGNARAETGARGIGPGLTLGGGDGLGGPNTLDEFCCKAYLKTVQERIERNWSPGNAERGLVTVRFTVHRAGDVSDVSVVQHGTYLMDRAAQVAFRGLALPPLPVEYTLATLTLQLTFEYK